MVDRGVASSVRCAQFADWVCTTPPGHTLLYCITFSQQFLHDSPIYLAAQHGDNTLLCVSDSGLHAFPLADMFAAGDKENVPVGLPPYHPASLLQNLFAGMSALTRYTHGAPCTAVMLFTRECVSPIHSGHIDRVKNVLAHLHQHLCCAAGTGAAPLGAALIPNVPLPLLLSSVSASYVLCLK